MDILNILVFLFLVIFMPIFDYFIYLKREMNIWNPIINKIKNGRITPMRKILILPIYLILAFSIMYLPNNVYEAMLLGFVAYSTFDLTIGVLFEDITYTMILKDIIWGSIFFGITYKLKNFILKRLNKKNTKI